MPNKPLDVDSTDVLLFLLETQSSGDRTRTKIRDRCQLTPKHAEEVLRRLTDLGLITKVSDYYNLTPAGKTKAKELDLVRKSPGGDQTHITLHGDVLNSSLTVTGISENVIATPAKPKPATDVSTQQTRFEALATPLDYSDVTGMAPVSPMLTNKDGDPTLDISDRPIPPYTIHPLRFTDTSFQQNERLKHEPDMAVRYVLTFEDYPAALPLPVVDRDSMGRSRSNDMWVRYDGCISGEHCRFHIKKTKGVYELYIEDLKSKNGTFVDGQRIVPGKQVPLRHGTRLRIGRTNMIVTQIAEPLPLLSEALKKAAMVAPQPKAADKPVAKTADSTRTGTK